jgi:WD40 repeat protein/serine/threonine protein kinase
MAITKLGKYEIIEEIGHGGYGTVYRAYDTVLDIERAVKVLHPALVAAPEFIERFQHEAKIAARLDHPHIVPVYELGEAQGSYYLVMKIMTGGSLRDLLSQNAPMPFVRALEIMRQVSDALSYAHKQGLIHRDIKPGNILFEDNGTARLSDFGFAKALSGGSSVSLSVSGGMIGTPSYMAPEVWRGQKVDPETDIYSLACVFYEMITGHILFEGDSPPEVMTKHMLDGPQFPTSWPQGVPEGIGEILGKALDKDPEKRYQHAADFVNELENLLDVKAKRVSEISHLTSPSTEDGYEDLKFNTRSQIYRIPDRVDSLNRNYGLIRRGWLVWLGAIALLAVLIIFGLRDLTPTIGSVATLVPERTSVAFGQAIALPTQTPIIQLPVLQGTPYPQPNSKISPENAKDVVQLARWGKGTVNQVAWSPDEKLLAAASCLGVYIYDAKTLQEVHFTETATCVTNVAFSPDGTKLASGSNDMSVKLWDMRDYKLLQTLSGHTESITSVAFSPDGTKLASASFDKTVKLWDVMTGQFLRTLSGDSDLVFDAAFSPDGDTIASASQGQSIRIWNVATGRLLHTLQGQNSTGAYLSVAFSPNGQILASSLGDTVQLWNTLDWSSRCTMKVENGGASSITFSPDGHYMAGDSAELARIWDVSTCELVKAVNGPTSKFVAFSPVSSWLISVERASNNINFIQVSDWNILKTIKMDSFIPDSSPYVFSPDSNSLVYGLYDGELKLWDIASGKLLHTMKGHSAAVTSVAFSPDNVTLASASGDGTIKLWSVASGQLLKTLPANPSTTWGSNIAFSPDGALLASASDNHTVKLWVTATGNLSRSLAIPSDTSATTGPANIWIAFSANGNTVAAFFQDSVFGLWKVADGQLVQSSAEKGPFIRFAGFSQHSNILALGNIVDKMDLMDAATGELLYSLPGDSGQLNSLAFSPDGTVLADAGLDGVKLWGAANGQLLHSLTGVGMVEDVAFSPDGAILGSGSFDGTINLWDVISGELLSTLKGHTVEMSKVVFTPDGRMLISIADDGTIRLWGVKP